MLGTRKHVAGQSSRFAFLPKHFDVLLQLPVKLLIIICNGIIDGIKPTLKQRNRMSITAKISELLRNSDGSVPVSF